MLAFPPVSPSLRHLLPLAPLAALCVACAHAPPPEKLSFKDAGLVDPPADPVGPIAPPVKVPAPRSIATEKPDVPPIDGDLVRFAADARARRFRSPAKQGFPGESRDAWEALVAQLDLYLAQALPQTPLMELVRARVTLEAEWDFDVRRYGAPPDDLLARVETRRSRLGTRIAAARALGQKIFLAKRTPGRLAWPIERAGISSTFGLRIDPLTHAKRMHGGLDLACGGERADVFILLVDHEHAALFGRALPRSGRGGELSDELPCHGFGAPGAQQGASAGIQAALPGLCGAPRKACAAALRQSP